MLVKIEKWLLFLLVLLLPSQLSYHWWPEWSLVFGVRVDYLSPTLFLTDLFVFTLLILDSFRGERIWIKPWHLCVVGFVTINILGSILPWLTAYKWLRIIILLFLVTYLVRNWKWARPIIQRGMVGSLVWVCGLAILQFLSQESIGGIWSWLGEWTFSLGTPGIAKTAIAGLGLLLRPYATLPHPNALAGWLLLGLVVLSGVTTRWNWVSRVAIGLGVVSLVLTMSRGALSTAILALVWAFPVREKILKLLLSSVLVIGVIFFVPGNPNSGRERQVLFQGAQESILRYPVLGTGLGASVVESPLLFQPVHNIYVLSVVEVGGLATLAAGVWLCARLMRVGYTKFSLVGLFVVGLTGMYDHYWLTLWQNNLMLAVFIAIVAVELAHAKPSSILRWRGSGKSGSGG